MTKGNAISAIVAYCNKEIDDFKLRADLAMSKAWREHIPVQLADCSLADSICDKVAEWCDDQDCPALAEEIEPEDIILNS